MRGWAAAAFVGGDPEGIVFGANMTSLNFTLTRTLGRELAAGDEILVTKLDHDANVSPWLELARDLGLEVGFVDDRLARAARPRRPRGAAL